MGYQRRVHGQEKAKKKALTDKANREIKLKKESKQKMDKERRAKIPKIYATVTRHIEKSGKAVKAVGAAEKKLKGATSERSKKALGKALKEKKKKEKEAKKKMKESKTKKAKAHKKEAKAREKEKKAKEKMAKEKKAKEKKAKEKKTKEK